MRRLLPLLLVVAACGTPATSSITVAPTAPAVVAPTIADSTVDELATATCDGFQTLWLYEIVELAETELGVSTVDGLVMVGVIVATTCPELIDMYIEELYEQYPSLVDEVTRGIEAAGSA